MTVRCACMLSCLTAILILAGCSNAANRAITATVGVDTGVALETSGSLTSLLTAQSLGLAATVENPSNTDGVTWTLSGVGSLSALTNTTATYNAPDTVSGSATALITATSIANPTQQASVALIVLGTPLIDPLTLFPGNVNVAYQAPVTAAGGDAPFTWEVLSGTLPPGLALNGSTSASTYLTGTPTAAGTYKFTLRTTDTLSRVASVALTMVVNPETACALAGRYTLMFTGFRGGSQATHVAAINISSTGTITGEEDYKDPHVTESAITLSSGTCVNRETNTGVLTLNAAWGPLVYNFAATPPYTTDSKIHSAVLQLISSGSDSGSGLLLLQDSTAITAVPPTGNFAFGVLGVNGSGIHFGSAGRFTSSAAGVLSAGFMDSNAPTALTQEPVTGTLSAPDSNGRGRLTLTAGSQATTFAYYIVDAGKMFLMDIDPTSGGGTTRLAGQMTAQVGNVSASSFDNGAMVTPSILSLYGAVQGPEPITVLSLGRLFDASAAAGTVSALLDTSNQAADVGAEAFAGQKYDVAANGRGTLELTDSSGSHALAFYLDGISDGYLIEQGTTAGSAGFLETQFQGPYENAPPGGIFPPTLINGFVSGTAYPQAPGPITLNALLYLNFDALSSNFVNGSFAIDPTSGRGLGTITESGVGQTPASLYIVSPTRMEMLQFGTRGVDGTIQVMIQN